MRHPLEKFRHCPVCGSEHFEEHDVKSKQCRDCGFIYYANAAASTAAFIMRADGCLLVARRGKDPARGTLDLVGGFADMGETVEEGMLREIREESGLVLYRPRYLFSIPNQYEYSGMTIHTLDLFFLLQAPEQAAPKAGDDASELMWIPLDEVRPELFGLKSIRQGVEHFIVKKSEFLQYI